PDIKYKDINAKCVSIDEIGLPSKEDMLFKYNILEANTSIKPWMFEYVFKMGYDKVIYFDPDIYIYNSIEYIPNLLDQYFMILTPHLTDFLNDEYLPGELEIIKAGSYNLGFIAIHRDAQLNKFLKWWQSKLVNSCYIAFGEGIFCDQKWMELAPSLFDNVYLLKNDGCNVAYWNLSHRKIKKNEFDEYYVNNEKLTFFHFSGLDPFKPSTLSKYQNRYKLSDIKLVEELVFKYIEQLKINGLSFYSKIPYKYDYFSNGVTIPPDFRKAYFKNKPSLFKNTSNPFDAYRSLSYKKYVIKNRFLQKPIVRKCKNL
ncbi:MAG: hypothetical protein JSV25_03170, partial [Spirochaetota bacterium]